MEITVRDLMTVVHGMVFGALFMLAFSGAIGIIYATVVAGTRWEPAPRDTRMFRFYLISMAVLAWLTVITGSYIVYPWYRAVPPAGITDLAGFPQRLLLSSPSTAGWHDFGMEWKEHIAWFTPIAMTMVVYVFIKYGPGIALFRDMRRAILGFVLVAFIATGVAGAMGAFLNKYAPVRGGGQIVIMQDK